MGLNVCVLSEIYETETRVAQVDGSLLLCAIVSYCELLCALLISLFLFKYKLNSLDYREVIALFVFFFSYVCIFASSFLLTCILFLINADVNWLPGSASTLIFTFNIFIACEQAHLWVGYCGQRSWQEEWGEEM